MGNYLIFLIVSIHAVGLVILFFLSYKSMQLGLLSCFSYRAIPCSWVYLVCDLNT